MRANVFFNQTIYLDIEAALGRRRCGLLFFHFHHLRSQTRPTNYHFVQRRLEALSEAKAVSDAKVSSLEQLVRSLRADLKASQKAEKEHQQQIVLLTESQKKSDAANHDLKAENERLQQQVGRYQEEEKEREMELQDLRAEVKQLKLQNLDPSKYEEWGPEEICQWIMGIDGGRFVKYEKAVRANLKEEEADGPTLAEVDGADLKRFGVTKLSDIKFLQKQIGKLVANNAKGGGSKDAMFGVNPMENEGNNPAPTAYV